MLIQQKLTPPELLYSVFAGWDFDRATAYHENTSPVYLRVDDVLHKRNKNKQKHNSVERYGS